MKILDLCVRLDKFRYLPDFKEAVESFTVPEIDEDIAEVAVNCFDADAVCYGEGIGPDYLLPPLVQLLDELQGRREGTFMEKDEKGK